jgi:hypothetical protein
MENSGWGYTRIRGALGDLGHEVGRNTIKRILLDQGLEPAPTRGKRLPWRTFLKAHFGVIAAMDFFAVEALTFRGLVRYFVLFVIDLGTRRVEIAGIARQPDAAWMKQLPGISRTAWTGFSRVCATSSMTAIHSSPTSSAASFVPRGSNPSSSQRKAPT